MTDFNKVVIALIIGFNIIFMVILIGLVFTTGSTFGQRCTKMDYTGIEHHNCVKSLSNGNKDF